MIGPQVNGNRFRMQRFARFLALADGIGGGARPIRILDLGGAKEYWEALYPMWHGRDFEITMINLDRPDEDIPPHYRQRTGNACSLPQFADNSFDLVHSNSVIEHVGSWTDMQAMAREVMRLAPNYFIQTPNFWFPLEAHYRVPFMQLLPEYMRASMLMRKGWGFVPKQGTMSDAMKTVQGINLLTSRQLEALFPDSHIYHERVAGMTKSITAIR